MKALLSHLFQIYSYDPRPLRTAAGLEASSGRRLDGTPNPPSSLSKVPAPGGHGDGRKGTILRGLLCTQARFCVWKSQPCVLGPPTYSLLDLATLTLLLTPDLSFCCGHLHLLGQESNLGNRATCLSPPSGRAGPATGGLSQRSSGSFSFFTLKPTPVPGNPKLRKHVLKAPQ